MQSKYIHCQIFYIIIVLLVTLCIFFLKCFPLLIKKTYNLKYAIKAQRGSIGLPLLFL